MQACFLDEKERRGTKKTRQTPHTKPQMHKELQQKNCLTLNHTLTNVMEVWGGGGGVYCFHVCLLVCPSVHYIQLLTKFFQKAVINLLGV